MPRTPIWGAIMPPVEIDALVAASRRWMAGGEAPETGVLSVGQTGREAQLRMLAEAAQLRQIALRPTAPTNLAPAAALPDLDLPLLPDAARPLFRRLIKLTNERSHAELVTGLMAKRGVMAHPFDWLPPKDPTGFPPEYHALAAWQAGADEAMPSALTAETWDDFLPAARRAAFADLRAQDPASARALLEANVTGVAADERDELVRQMSVGLSPDDQPFLEALLGDRSGKVKASATRLLARLGVVTGGEAATDLAAYFDASKGFLRRKLTVAVKGKLNQVQRNTLIDLLGAVPAPAFAAALDLSETDLADALDLGNTDLVGPFIASFAQSAGDRAFAALWARVVEAGLATVPHIEPALARLTRDEVFAAAEVLLRKGVYHSLADVARLTGPALPATTSSALLGSPRLKDQIEEARNALIPDAKPYVRQAALGSLAHELRVAGCLLTAGDAAALRDKLSPAIYHAADPALDPLHFNIALEGTRP